MSKLCNKHNTTVLLKINKIRNSHCGSAEWSQLVSMRMHVWFLASIGGQGLGIAMSCGVVCRHGSDPEWLWLCHRLAAAVPIWPLAWKLPYVAGAACKIKIKINKINKINKNKSKNK